MTIRQILDRVCLPKHAAFVVSVAGRPVLPADYGTMVPAAGDFVAIRAVPTGGGDDKDPLRIILQIAIIVASIITYQYYGIWAAMAVSVGGNLLINALCPPYIPTNDVNGPESWTDSPTYSLSAPSNRLNPYGPIPSLLGKYRIYPPYAARPYTENIGDDQYLRMLFNLGTGRIDVSEVKLGETLLSAYRDYEMEIIPGEPGVVKNSSLFPGDIYQDDLSVLLRNADGWHVETTQNNVVAISTDITFMRGLIEFDAYGNRVGRTVQLELQYSEAGAGDWKGALNGVSIGVQNFELDGRYVPQTPWYGGEQYYGYHLVVVNKATGGVGVIYGQSHWDPDRTDLFPECPAWACPLARIVVYMTTGEYSETWYMPHLYDVRPAEFVSAGYFAVSWTSGARFMSAGAGTVKTDVYTVGGCTTSMVRRTFYFPVPRGRYDVRLCRYTGDAGSDQIYDEVTWTALRSYQVGAPVLEPGISMLALKMRATEQLSGIINDLNAIGHVVCLDYDSGQDTWVERPTSNLASLYRYVLQGPANKRPLTDAQIDIDTLEQWHERCRVNGWTFNHYIDYKGSVDDTLAMVAAAGRASRSYVDGKYSVVMDRPQTNIAQHFTPRNTWGYKYNKTFQEPPHGYRVKFRNADAGYKEDERIVYDDGYSETNATLIEEFIIPGIVTADLAYKHGRYHIAARRLRPETHTFYTDFEHLTCTRGDLVKFASDVILAGLGYGRVKSYTDDGVNVLAITVDEELSMETGKMYNFRIRKHDGSSHAVRLVTVPGTHKTFTVDSLLPVALAPDDGALFMYGEAEEEAIDVLVLKILPGKDLTAHLTCIPAAPEVHNADTGTIPPFNTHISAPLDRWQIYVPVIDQVRADETVMGQSSTGMPIARILVTLMPQEFPEGAVDRLQARYTLQGTNNPYLYAETTSLGEIALESGIIEGETYVIQVRYRIDGRWGKWSAETAVTVSRQVTNPPATPAGMTIDFTGKDCLFAWTPSIDIAFDHYLLTINGHPKIINQRQQSSYAYTFDENAKDNAGAATSLAYNLKVVDVFGTESAALTGTAANGAPAVPTGIQLASAFKAFTVVFPPNTETDIKGYEIHVSTSDGFTPGPGTLYASGPQTSARYEGEANTTYYVRARAYDWFGNFSGYSAQQSIGTASSWLMNSIRRSRWISLSGAASSASRATRSPGRPATSPGAIPSTRCQPAVFSMRTRNTSLRPSPQGPRRSHPPTWARDSPGWRATRWSSPLPATSSPRRATTSATCARRTA